MSFTDQKPRIATTTDTAQRWGGEAPGERFRCYMCGARFGVGSQWRFVLGADAGRNFMVCVSCDGPDVLDRWRKQNEELKTRFWWAMPRD